MAIEHLVKRKALWPRNGQRNKIYEKENQISEMSERHTNPACERNIFTSTRVRAVKLKCFSAFFLTLWSQKSDRDLEINQI